MWFLRLAEINPTVDVDQNICFVSGEFKCNFPAVCQNLWRDLQRLLKSSPLPDWMLNLSGCVSRQATFMTGQQGRIYLIPVILK